METIRKDNSFSQLREGRKKKQKTKKKEETIMQESVVFTLYTLNRRYTSNNTKHKKTTYPHTDMQRERKNQRSEWKSK